MTESRGSGDRRERVLDFLARAVIGVFCVAFFGALAVLAVLLWQLVLLALGLLTVAGIFTWALDRVVEP
jgi:ABC-type bacteriocin/lantibiotic exporter with double-glycine peptidase domain